MSENWRIAHSELAEGMQVKSEGCWWQVHDIVVDGRQTGTMTLRAARCRSDGTQASRPRLIWLPITGLGAEVRPGVPSAGTVIVNDRRRGVVYQPRRRGDVQPYVDAHGERHRRNELLSYHRVLNLAAAFATGLAS
jgi:hypothetical protein